MGYFFKDKKSISSTDAFPKILDKSNRRPNKTWVVKGRKFYNISMKSWLEKDNIEMYSTNNEVKSVIAEILLE